MRMAKRPTISGPSQRDTATLLPTLSAMITIWRITSAIAAPLIFPRKRVCSKTREPDDGGTAAQASAISPASRERSSSIRESGSFIKSRLWLAGWDATQKLQRQHGHRRRCLSDKNNTQVFG